MAIDSDDESKVKILGRDCFFIGVGPTKTCTSWMDQMFRQHPEVDLPMHVKETFFFSSESQGGLDRYETLYGDASGKVAGEFGPTYFSDNRAIQAIKKIDNAKIIISLRDPVERSVSHFLHSFAKGRAKKIDPDFFSNPNVYRSSFYCYWVKRWIEAVGEENVILIDSRMVADSYTSVLSGISSFIGVSDIPWTSPEKRVGEGISPRFPILSKFMAGAASVFRSWGFHKFVNLMKKIGLKGVAFKNGKVSFEEAGVDTKFLEFLRNEFESSIKFYSDIFDDGTGFASGNKANALLDLMYEQSPDAVAIPEKVLR
ncbi:sulfotransferase [Alcanivorax sp. JB21]|uniref:sulfotransferase domain-containing protein n=1 Tax=Alcanivorax limicola TaxID=2874102 RepID=UPI001CBD23FC|nr:sulfotransferase domain-containing protein [Alcanivorax limicola]MBZ2188138.1 sulfotransferase [Alcanivorax limicola]